MKTDKDKFHVVRNNEQLNKDENSDRVTTKEEKGENMYKGLSKKSQKNKDENQIDQTDPTDTNSEQKAENKPILSKFFRQYSNNALFATIFGSLIVCIISFIMNNIFVFHDIKRDVVDLTTNVDKMQESMIDKSDWNTLDSTINKQFENVNQTLNKLDDRTDDLDKRLAIEESRYHNMHKGTATPTLINCVANMNNAETASVSKSKLWKNSDVLVYDKTSGEKTAAKEITDRKLLCSYTDEGGSEVFFFGQFNERNCWDGNCLINVYTNNKLRLITDAIYSNGTLISYKQVLASANAAGEGVWLISKRNCNGNINNGDTWSYYFESDFKKNFTLDNVSIVNILNINDFKNMLKTNLEGFYHGNTSAGKYNDDTGTAYLVKFAKDGTVKTFYNGNFADGNFNDNTGTAWEIARNEKIFDSKYMFKKGCFKNGKFDDNYKYKTIETDMTEAAIKAKMKHIIPICKIVWYGFEKSI